MKRSALFLATAASALFLTSAAMAGETYNATNGNITIEQASQLLHYSGGNDRMRVEIAPNYSEDLGWSLKGAAGSYLTDEIALGLIVEYGENKREYLANAGIQFNDALSFVGSVGMLEEHNEYVDGDGRKTVQQMEYGASLKGAYEVGILSGFELNGYLTNADAGSKTVETGKLYGAQLLADFDLTDTTHFKLGGGYEWLEWGDGDNNDSFAFSAEGTQQLGEMFSINANASIGASENVYGGGLALDLSRGGANTNTIGVNYSYIDGKNGIGDDQRVELGWTIGFGAGPTQTASVETRDAGAIRPVADVAMVSPANNLLGDVMKRPKFLPERVLARAKSAKSSCVALTMTPEDESIFASGYDGFSAGDGNSAYDAIRAAGISDLQVTVNGVTTHFTPTVLGIYSSGLYFDNPYNDAVFEPDQSVSLKIDTVDGACYETEIVTVGAPLQSCAVTFLTDDWNWDSAGGSTLKLFVAGIGSTVDPASLTWTVNSISTSPTGAVTGITYPKNGTYTAGSYYGGSDTSMIGYVTFVWDAEDASSNISLDSIVTFDLSINGVGCTDQTTTTLNFE